MDAQRWQRRILHAEINAALERYKESWRYLGQDGVYTKLPVLNEGIVNILTII